MDVLSRERERLERWIGQGFHAGMNYMANNIEKRENPALLVEGARSVIVTLTNYYTRNSNWKVFQWLPAMLTGKIITGW